MVIFFLIPLSTSQVGIVCAISNMDDNLHPKISKRKRFKVVKFLNITTRLIHQMWDEMVTMIVIEKDNRMVTIFEVA